MTKDLEGVTLLDFGGVGPVARGVRVLSDLGVRWIQVAAPASAARHAPPWHSYGALRGAEQVELDLKDPAGRDAALKIASQVDVVMESFRPGVAKRLGIDYDAVKAKNSRVIYCALTGYGQSGPYAGWAGHDLNYQAVAGGLSAAGRDKDGAPALPGLTLADSAGGGWLAVIRILAALHARGNSGKGQFIDASATEGVMHLNSLALDEYLATGVGEGNAGGMTNGAFAGYAIYRCADGKFISTGAIEPKFFKTLVETLGLPQLAARQMDPAMQDEHRRQIAAAFAKKPRDEWMKQFAKLDACVAPVLSIPEIANDPHVAANGMIVEYQHPEQGKQRQVRPFGPPGTQRGDPPRKGQGREVLKGFGFSDAEIAALKA
jgi:alpha-methylacyl-CoA racemase